MPYNVDNAKSGISALGDYAGSLTAGAAIQKLIDLLEPDTTGITVRNHLDEMSPAAQVQLLVELDAMKAVVNLFEA